MQKIIIKGLLIVTLFSSVKGQAIQQDKMLHFATAFALTQLGYHVFRKTGCDKWCSVVFPMVIVNSLGIMKEFYIDKTPDQGDINANVLGSVAGGLISISLDF
jgi:VanZ family protein